MTGKLLFMKELQNVSFLKLKIIQGVRLIKLGLYLLSKRDLGKPSLLQSSLTSYINLEKNKKKLCV